MNGAHRPKQLSAKRPRDRDLSGRIDHQPFLFLHTEQYSGSFPLCRCDACAESAARDFHPTHSHTYPCPPKNICAPSLRRLTSRSHLNEMEKRHGQATGPKACARHGIEPYKPGSHAMTFRLPKRRASLRSREHVPRSLRVGLADFLGVHVSRMWCKSQTRRPKGGAFCDAAVLPKKRAFFFMPDLHRIRLRPGRNNTG